MTNLRKIEKVSWKKIKTRKEKTFMSFFYPLSADDDEHI